MATNFPSVTIQGNVLTFDSLQQVAQGKDTSTMPKQAARDYGFKSEEALRQEIQRNWADALDQYGIFQRQLERLEPGATGVSETRSRWLLPFLSLLGYETRVTKAQVIDERRYAISHALSNEETAGFPLHLVGVRQSLDRKADGMRLSPHALVQEYLNRHENLYAVVSNGKFLRLLRDSSNLTKLSYVEFDLTRMFEEKLFNDFALLFRLLHVSRLPTEPGAGTDSILEKYHQEGLKSGSRIRDNLSKAVEAGILQLGSGLLQDRENQALRDWVAKQDQDAARLYYNHLLKLIYRLLFVMVIEERDLIFPKQDKGADAGAREGQKSEAVERQRRIYYEYYALKRLRKLATTYQLAGERQYDLWDSLMNTFALFEDRGIGTKLGIEPLAGGLFREDALGPLTDCRLNNRALLESLRGLSQFTDEDSKTVQIVNYASLDVEEFGSVYEGLLEYDPVVNLKTRTFSFEAGQDRSSSGSHYTPDELVQPLIKHSLEHLIADRTVAPDASAEKRTEARQKLLKLKVADVACGSGHILLAAARRIGLELARLASGAEQPSPPEIRQGTRDAIRNCIYGVDKNPLAVELCQVALWLEAHLPGQPLNFLDHRIRCGDAIVGVGRLEDLRKGIPTEAFKNYPGDSEEAKDNGKALRKRNKQERKEREAGGGSLSLFNQLDTVEDQLAAFQNKYEDFARLPETTPAEIEVKAKAYRKLTTGSNWWFIKTLADVQTAQFFLGLEDEEMVVTDATYFEMLGGAHRQSRAAAAATGESAERGFFHWFLEFPEVFAGGGFDCVVGNPPYLGGMKISTDLGEKIHDYLFGTRVALKGRTDLVANFFVRAFEVLRDDSSFVFITTNSISEGETREGGLRDLVKKGAQIFFADRSKKWPGVASVSVTTVGVRKGKYFNTAILDGKEVHNINSYLLDMEEVEPEQLGINSGVAMVGAKPNGKGFIIKRGSVLEELQSDETTNEVVKKYVTNQSMSNTVDISSNRYVFYFRNWNETKVQDYPVQLEALRRLVFKERQKKGGKLAERWWNFEHTSTPLHNYLDDKGKVIAIGNTGKYLPTTVLEKGIVLSDTCIGFKRDDFSFFSFISSSFHTDWIGFFGPKMKNDLRYVPSSCFETYPFPEGNLHLDSKELSGTANNYVVNRRNVLFNLQLGLTKLYNQFHNPHLLHDYDDLWVDDVLTDPKKLKDRKQSKETYNLWRHLDRTEGTIGMGEAVERIVELRKLHKEMDEAVLAAYGWHVDTRRWGPALRLRHDFYEVDYLPEKDNVRYTIHPDARREVLKRLLLLNHEIHEAEERGVDYAVVDGEKVEALLIEQLRAWCPRADALHWKTRKFLCTGEDLLPNLERSLTKSYKPFVTAYASGLEAEFQHKIFIAWNDKFQSRWKVDDGSRETYLNQQASVDGKLRMFAGMLKKSDVKYTLGNMAFILNLVKKPTGNTIQASTLLQDFRAFVVSVYGEAVLEKGFLVRVDGFVKAYRNEAAHTGEVDKGMAEGCRDEVRGMVTLLVENEKTDG